MAIEPFNDDYFEHYAEFDYSKKTEYDLAYNRFMGNLNIQQVMFSLYKSVFKTLPKRYVDLGCGTGEEMAWYKTKGIDVIGCDISPYVLNRKNPLVSDFIHETNSIDFMNKYNQKADVIIDSTLQYLDDFDFNVLMNLIKNKTSDKCVFGIIFDTTKRNHPYRKQLHSFEEWNNIISSYGFKQAAEYINNIFISKIVENATKDYIFIKGF